MRPALRKSHPRHLAGSVRSPWEPREVEADFDVAAALDADSDYDFDALFAGDGDADDAPAPRARAARHKVALAASITIAALPVLALDNFHATAESPSTATVEAAAGAAKDELRSVVTLPDRLPTSEVPPVEVTIGTATVFVEAPTTSTTEAAVEATTTTDPPAPTTTTTAKPRPTTTTTTAAPAKAAPPPAAATGADPSDPETWERLAQCESGGNWQAVSQPRSGMQYYGGLQFSLATWQGVGGTGYPHEAPKATQIEMGKKLQARQGWNAWPGCSRKLGWIS